MIGKACLFTFTNTNLGQERKLCIVLLQTHLTLVKKKKLCIVLILFYCILIEFQNTQSKHIPTNKSRMSKMNNIPTNKSRMTKINNFIIGNQSYSKHQATICFKT